MSTRAQIIFTSKKNGRRYDVLRSSRGILISVNSTPTTQSIGGTGPTYAYYDEIAANIPSSARTCLLLGVAGATVARRAKELGKKCVFVGVDNDPEMIRLGELFFNLKKYVQIIHIADARKFCRHYTGHLFDCVVDDLYVDALHRVPCDARRLVRRGGTLITHNLGKGVLIEQL